jgi:glycosyltransferase involved in cell wall biosynthesis
VNIGIDVRPLQTEHRYRGIGVYLTQLIAAIAALDRGNTYFFYMFAGDDALEGIPLRPGFKHERVRVSKPFGPIQLTHLRPPLSVDPGQLDVFLVTDSAFGLPRGGVPTAAVAYDVVPVIFKNEYFPRSPRQMLRRLGPKSTLASYVNRWLYRRQLRALKAASGVLAISESTKRDLLRLGLYRREASITVTPLACDPVFFAGPPPSDVLRRRAIVAPYLLYVGGTDFRKNPRDLLRAFEELRGKGHELQLVFVGKDFSGNSKRANPELWEELDHSATRKDVVLIDYVPTEELRTLYAQATAFVFPSLYEGFGIPILEAMASGCPVIAYDNSSIAEVAGDAALLIATGESLASAVETIITRPALRATLIDKGRLQAERFTWAQTAELTVQALGRFANRPAG